MASPLHTQSKIFCKTSTWSEQDTLWFIMYPDMPKAGLEIKLGLQVSFSFVLFCNKSVSHLVHKMQ